MRDLALLSGRLIVLILSALASPAMAGDPLVSPSELVRENETQTLPDYVRLEKAFSETEMTERELFRQG